MLIDLTIKNYRCFADSKPARITIRDGFTAFVGVNNSGKSSLLRFFFELRQLFKQLACPGADFLEALGKPRAFNPASDVLDVSELFCSGNNRGIEIRLQITPDGKSALPVPNELLITLPRATNQYRVEMAGHDIRLDKSLQWNGTVLRVTARADAPGIELGPYFEAFRTLGDTLYVGAFRNAIHVGTKDNYFDIQIGQSFIKRWQSLQSGATKQHNQAIIKLVDEIKEIFGLRKLEILPADNGETLHLNINDTPRKLAEVGAGIAQLVVVLANAATKNPAFVLIDEPELNLHPSLQLRFLTALGSYARNGVLLATHNIGLARASAQLIYSIWQNPAGESEVKPYEATPSLSEFLGELSFSGYRELGFKRVLLVEGVNEILTIQQFLRWNGKDHQVVLLSLGGSQFITGTREAELQEIKRISDEIFTLIDSERSSETAPLEKDRQDFEHVCKRCKITCHVLKRRAIENYFPGSAVQRVKGANARALQPYEALKDLGAIGWSKSDNWRIAREMTAADLEGTDLGDFLARL